MKPSSGLYPPTASSSRSDSEREFSLTTGRVVACSRSVFASSPETTRLISRPPWAGLVSPVVIWYPFRRWCGDAPQGVSTFVRYRKNAGLLVQPALLELGVLPPPAAGANVLARLDGAGARCATNAGEAFVVQLVVGDLVLFDVGPDVVVGPLDD